MVVQPDKHVDRISDLVYIFSHELPHHFYRHETGRAFGRLFPPEDCPCTRFLDASGFSLAGS